MFANVGTLQAQPGQASELVAILSRESSARIGYRAPVSWARSRAALSAARYADVIGTGRPLYVQVRSASIENPREH